jgi:hypothetical protein
MAQAKAKADVPIEALLKEKRNFAPPKSFVQKAVMPVSWRTRPNKRSLAAKDGAPESGWRKRTEKQQQDQSYPNKDQAITNGPLI